MSVTIRNAGFCALETADSSAPISMDWSILIIRTYCMIPAMQRLEWLAARLLGRIYGNLIYFAARRARCIARQFGDGGIGDRERIVRGAATSCGCLLVTFA